ARPFLFFFFQAEDGIRDFHVTGVQTCALPISRGRTRHRRAGSPAKASPWPSVGRSCLRSSSATLSSLVAGSRRARPWCPAGPRRGRSRSGRTGWCGGAGFVAAMRRRVASCLNVPSGERPVFRAVRYTDAPGHFSRNLDHTAPGCRLWRAGISFHPGGTVARNTMQERDMIDGITSGDPGNDSASNRDSSSTLPDPADEPDTATPAPPTSTERWREVTLDDVFAARKRVMPHLHRTPLMTSRTLAEMAGCPIAFKA